MKRISSPQTSKVEKLSRLLAPTKYCARVLLPLFAMYWLFPAVAHAKYTDMAIGQSLFCGVLENGQTDCFTTNFREPAFLNADPSITFTEIAAGAYTFCGITTGQQISCWADDTDGMLSPPVFDAPVVQLSVQGWYACAADSAANVKCWGQNNHGQTEPPGNGAGFIDVTTEFSYACGLRANSTVECWGTENSSTTNPAISVLPAEANDLTSIDFVRTLHCGIQASGNALCWKPTGELVARFDNGPYKEVMPLVNYPHTTIACAQTFAGELDCTVDELELDGEVTQLAAIQRLPDVYLAMDNGLTQEVCTYHSDKGLECPVSSRGVSSRVQQLLDLVNGNLILPSVVITDAAYYGFGVEVFYNSPDISEYTHSVFYDVDLFRDGEFLARTENARSYVDRTAEPNRSYSYSARSVHLFGQIGTMSNPLTVVTQLSENALDNNPVPARPNEPKDLRAEVYWFDVELFWERDVSGNVRNYEIRRDGELVATTRGTSWYDNSTEGGQRYVYDVIAVAENDAILGFRSVPVQIGELQCH